jgi:hypothetical protein
VRLHEIQNKLKLHKNSVCSSTVVPTLLHPVLVMASMQPLPWLLIVGTRWPFTLVIPCQQFHFDSTNFQLLCSLKLWFKRMVCVLESDNLSERMWSLIPPHFKMLALVSTDWKALHTPTLVNSSLKKTKCSIKCLGGIASTRTSRLARGAGVQGVLVAQKQRPLLEQGAAKMQRTLWQTQVRTLVDTVPTYCDDHFPLLAVGIWSDVCLQLPASSSSLNSYEKVLRRYK